MGLAADDSIRRKNSFLATEKPMRACLGLTAILRNISGIRRRRAAKDTYVDHDKVSAAIHKGGSLVKPRRISP